MHVKRIIVSGFKALRSFDMELGENLNIIVGDNETGKTTVLEAVGLVLSGQMEGRSVLYDLDPYYFNTGMAAEYFSLLPTSASPPPPQIVIEAYLDDDGTNELARLKGTNNTRGEDCPGLSLAILLNVDLADDFNRRFPKDPDRPRNTLTAARLMAERFGRIAEARHLLEGLLEKYPAHPLTPEIALALADIARMPAVR